MKINSIYPLFLFFFPIILNAQLSVITDHSTGRYAVGDTAYFIVHSSTDSAATYVIKYAIGSDLPPIRTGNVKLIGGYAFISYVATTAGFVHCSVTQNGQNTYTGAAFDLFKIQPIEPEVANFDAFWIAQKTALAAVPMNVNVASRGRSDFADKYDFNIELTDGKRAYGYLNVPRGNGSYPAVIRLPAYGNTENMVDDDVLLAERAGVISVFLNVHSNLPNQQGPNNYLAIGLDNPSNYYLKHVLLGVVKTIDYLQTRADFNGQVGVIGVSQGGGLAVLAAGIDQRIGLLVNVYPALCAHPNLKYNKPSGFPSYWRFAQSIGLDANMVLNTVKYYDAVTAAKRFRGVSWTMVGYLDDVCNASTVYEAYNQIKGQKIMTHFLKKSHIDTPDEYAKSEFPTGMYAFFRRNFPASNNAPWTWLNKTLGYTIDVGKDIILTENKPVLLRGAVELEGVAANLPVRWEKIEGEGTVTFSNPQSLTTNVVFSQSGTYRLRLIAEDMSTIASDNKYTTLSDDITVVINPIVPVELMDFKGIITKNGNELSWSTASESANKSFELERSNEAINWELIGQLNGKGTTNNVNNYLFTDKNPFPIAYYRLKQIDFNGNFNYSKVISLKSIKKETIELFPNPFFNNLVIKINELKPPFELKIFDILGRIWSINTANYNEIKINTEHLINGNYFIEIKNKELTVIKKIIKSNQE